MITTAIFDMDGVITDSEYLHIEAKRQLFSKYNVHLSEARLQQFAGIPFGEIFNSIISEYGLSVTVEKLSSEVESILFRLFKEEGVIPVRGVIDFIRHLHSRGIKLAVASSSKKNLVCFGLEQLGIIPLFGAILTAEDISQGKPDPEIFLKAAARLESKPEHCIVIEDAHAGVVAAKRAHMLCLAYQNPKSGDQDLSRADKIINPYALPAV